MPTRLAFTLTMILSSALLLGCGEAEDSPDPPSTEKITAEGAERLDLADLLESELTSGEEPDWLVSGFGSLWAKQGSGDVLRVDPESGKLVAEIGDRKPGQRPPGGHLCQGIGMSEDAIWSCPQVGTIARIDPKTNEIATTVRLDNLGDQGHLVNAAGRVWVLTKSGATLTGIDTDTNKPSGPIDLGGRCGDLASDGATVWAMCPLEDRLIRIDPQAGEVSDEVELAGAANASVADDLWVGFEGGLAQIDEESLETLAVYDLSPRYGGGIYATADSVWVRVEGGPFLTRIDPESQQITQTIESPRLTSGGNVIEVGDHIWASAFDDRALVQLRTP